ncbi:MAG: hypothetical protein KGL39_33060 [Patescibacteria group bacterium]|nr:hypothetical protein [Patescibacteria group bacterium]
MTEPIRLTRREYSMAEALSLGLTNKGIADWAGIAEGTVKIYLSRLKQRLNIGAEYNLRLKIGLDFLAGRYRTETAEERQLRRYQNIRDKAEKAIRQAAAPENPKGAESTDAQGRVLSDAELDEIRNRFIERDRKRHASADSQLRKCTDPDFAEPPIVRFGSSLS